MTSLEIPRSYLILVGGYAAVLCLVYLIADLGVGLVCTIWIWGEGILVNHLCKQYLHADFYGFNMF